MRKVLLGTTAMVTAGMLACAPSAIAGEAPLKLGITGVMEQWLGYSAQDGRTGQDYSGFNQISDTEVIFKGSTDLDNGLTVGVDVQLEGNSTADQIDESYMWISGNFGKFILGSENSAQYIMHHGVQDFGIGLISGDAPAWITPIADDEGDVISMGSYYRGTLGSTYIEPTGMNDTEGVTYFTPRFQGVQIGLSYKPDAKGEDSSAMPNRDVDMTDAITGSVNYVQSFDNANVGVSLGYGTVSRTTADDDSDPTALNMGLRVGFGGLGIEASYGAFDDTGARNGESYAVGANYSMGPWGISLAYMHGERDGTGSEATNDLDNQAAAKTLHLSSRYALGPGVSFRGTLGHTRIESDDVAIDDSVDDISATYLVVGVAVSY